MNMKNVVLYNLNKNDSEIIRLYMRQEGYEVHQAERLEDVIEIMKDEELSLVLMDVCFESGDGTARISAIRKQTGMPILVLSANDTEQMKIAALNAGADDYVINPYHPLELLARINCQFSRYQQLARMCDNIDRIYRVDELTIDDGIRKVTVGGKEVRLTPIEYKILRLLVQERGKVLSIDQIYESIWNMRAIGADNTIAVHIRHIREKIESNPKEPRYLKVVWGTGYKVG